MLGDCGDVEFQVAIGGYALIGGCLVLGDALEDGAVGR